MSVSAGVRTASLPDGALPLYEALARLRASLSEDVHKKSRVAVLQKQEDLRVKKQFAEVPERYLDSTFDTFKTPQVDAESVAALKSWASGLYALQAGFKQFRSCVITGRNGSGKTHLGMSILAYSNYSGLYISSPRLCMRLIRSRAYKALKDEETLLEAVASQPLLVLDEIGRARDAETEQHMIYDIVDMRYNKKLPVVLISNKGEKELQDYMGLATVDRLRENYLCVSLKAESYRRI